MNSSEQLKEVIGLTKSGHYNEALKIVEALDVNSLSPEEIAQYLLFKGSLFYSHERIIEAFECLREAKKLKPHDPEIRYAIEAFSRTEKELYKKKFKVRYDWMTK